MPDRYPNYFNPITPIGAALGNLGTAMFSGKSEAERNLLSAQTLKAQEEGVAAQRKNVGRRSVADMFTQYGQDKKPFDYGAMAGQGIYGDIDPKDVGGYVQFTYGNDLGARSPLTTNATVGAQNSFNSTAEAFDTAEANKISINDADNAAAMARTRYSEGQQNYRSSMSNNRNSPQALFSNYKKLALENGYDEASATNYAMTQASKHVGAMGGSSGLTNTVKSGLQQNNVAIDNLNDLIDMAEPLIKNNPNLVGAAGFVQKGANAASEAARGFGAMFGDPDADQRILQLRNIGLSDAGLSPSVKRELFDNDLPKVEALYNAITYAAASAIAGQEGRGISDADVKRAEAMVGKPASIFEGARTLQSKFQVLRQIGGGRQKTNDQALGNAPRNAPLAPAAGGWGAVKVSD